jgi:AraC-like DNA-binding protein
MVNYSGRSDPFYISLGPEPERRTCDVRSPVGVAPIDRFLDARIQGFTSVVAIQAGRGTLHTRNGDVRIEAGDVLVVPPGKVSQDFDGAHHVEVRALPVKVSTGAVIRASQLPLGIFERDDRALVAQLASAPHRAVIAGSSITTALMAALGAIERDPSRARLSIVAHDLGYTADGLTTLMQRETGRGFAAWREALAMAFVRARLRASTVTSIARDLGIDKSYVHRRFMRVHGTTPADWRKAPHLPAASIAEHWDTVGALLGTR